MSAPGRTPPGAQALRAALRRLAQRRPANGNGHTPEPAAGPWPMPESAWERAAETRLGRIEQQLGNQNRLLLFTLVSILADVVLGLTR